MIRRLIYIFTIKLKKLQERVKNYFLKILNVEHYEKKRNFKGGEGRWIRKEKTEIYQNKEDFYPWLIINRRKIKTLTTCLQWTSFTLLLIFRQHFLFYRIFNILKTLKICLDKQFFPPSLLILKLKNFLTSHNATHRKGLLRIVWAEQNEVFTSPIQIEISNITHYMQ